MNKKFYTLHFKEEPNLSKEEMYHRIHLCKEMFYKGLQDFQEHDPRIIVTSLVEVVVELTQKTEFLYVTNLTKIIEDVWDIKKSQ